MMVAMPARIEADWRARYREGEVVIWAWGRRIRLYAGHTNRIGGPLLNHWSAYGHAGVVLRFRRDGRSRRCFGVQWRDAALHEEQRQ